MNRGNWFSAALAAILAFLIFFVPQLAWQLRSYLVPQVLDDGDDGGENLAAEVAALKAELAKLENIKSQLPEKTYNYIRATVLSRYPFNFENEFLVGAGSAEGVEKGKAVVLSAHSINSGQGRVLVGRVSKVFGDTALVETVFDDDFEAAARIGPLAVDALMSGGLVPKLVLVPLNAQVNPGDVVYSASPDFPYGLAIGEVKDIRVSSDNLFREATLELSYDINEIRSVLINSTH